MPQLAPGHITSTTVVHTAVIGSTEPVYEVGRSREGFVASRRLMRPLQGKEELPKAFTNHASRTKCTYGAAQKEIWTNFTFDREKAAVPSWCPIQQQKG